MRLTTSFRESVACELLKTSAPRLKLIEYGPERIGTAISYPTQELNALLGLTKK